MASQTRWTWVWVNSRSWWWTGRPGVLDSWGRKESDTTERLIWSDLWSAKLDKWVSDELTENQINHHFEVLFSLILHSTNAAFLDQIVTCDEKWIFYDNWQQPAQGLDRESPKHCPKPNLHPPPKKVMVTVWWSAAHLIHYSFLNPDKTITAEKYAQQVSEMDQKVQHPQPTLVKGPSSSPWQHPTAHHTTSTSKVEQIG